ncbi:hypothetical protein BD779DRAFT_503593 [Infundibulicybe gibba]|nr:hypothetical protein BD779DRAFT_503593 [Infundibulicybe gibba]
MAMRTILVLGDPENNDLDAVLNVPNNLVLVVTQDVPTTPSPPRATVLVLLLNSPLAIHASGALRLASVLEQAHLIAKSWRSRPLTPAIYILTERNGEFQMQSRPSPRSSSEVSSIISHSTHKVSSRPFDVVINFIPPIPDPAVLKHAILVTSLANPFLSTSLVSHLGRRSSSSSFSFRTLAAPPADADALLIHVLPTPIPTRSKLVASIEHVVLSFTTPAHASPPTTRPSSPVSLRPQSALLPRTRAYLLPKGVLADPAGPPAHAYRAPSVARVLLEGHAALTPPPSKKVDGENMAGIGAFGSTRTHETRAWIGAGEDVMIPSGLLGSLDLKLSPPQSPKQPRSPLSSKPRVLSPKSPPTVPPGLSIHGKA